MAHIPVQRRQATPAWIWIVVGVIVLIIILALIDYFVTNIVIDRGGTAGTDQPGQQPQQPGQPFGAVIALAPLYVRSLRRRIHSASE